MPGRREIQRLVEHGESYEEVGRRYGLPPGRVYLIATGRPADGSDAPQPDNWRPGVLTSSQHLSNPPHENPTKRDEIRRWILSRVNRDHQAVTAAEKNG
jgi:hypothetical protein